MSETATSGFTTGRPDAPRRVLLLHGYTGSPDGFRELAEKIARESDAYVMVPLLPGHGTNLADLQKISFDEFVDSARASAEEIAAADKPFAIIGYCLGGYLATILAHEYQPAVLVIGLTAYDPRFPAWIPGFARLMQMRSSWDKFLYKDEVEMRRGLFYYPRIPGRAQALVNEGIVRMKNILPDLMMPILAIHTTNDPSVSPISGTQILENSGHNPNNEKYLLKNRRHALYFGPHKDEDMGIAVTFLKKNLK